MRGSRGFFSIHWFPPISVFIGRFAAFKQSLGNFKDPLQDSVDSIIIPSIKQNFMSGGPGWAPHAEATQERWPPHPLLRYSEKLMDAATSPGLWVFSKDKAALENIDQLPDYWAVQHFGGGPSEIPARPFFTFDKDKVADGVEDVFENWLAANAIKSGFNFSSRTGRRFYSNRDVSGRFVRRGF